MSKSKLKPEPQLPQSSPQIESTTAISGATDFILDSDDPIIIYERIGLIAETIGWLSIFEIYRNTSNTTLHNLIEQFIRQEIRGGINTDLAQALRKIDQIQYARLFMKINPLLNSGPGLFNDVLTNLSSAEPVPFWKNVALCWLVRDYQIIEKIPDRTKTLISVLSSFSDSILNTIQSNIIYLAGYDVPIISHPISNENIPEFSCLNETARVNISKLREIVGDKNLVILTTDPITETLGGDNIAELVTSVESQSPSSGITVIWEIPGAPTSNRSYFNIFNEHGNMGNWFTKYGLDTYHFRTFMPELMNLFVSDPDYLFRNIHRL